MGYAIRSHGKKDQGIKPAGSPEPSPECKIGCWELEVFHSAKLGYYHAKSLSYIKLTRDGVKPWHSEHVSSVPEV